MATEQIEAYHNLYVAVSQSLGFPPPSPEMLLRYEAAEMEMLNEGFADDARLKMVVVQCGADCSRIRMQLLSDSMDSLSTASCVSNFDSEFFIFNEWSNMLIDVNSSGNNLLMWRHHGGPNQRFTMRSGLIRALHSGLAITCGADGVVLQAPSTGAENQIWLALPPHASVASSHVDFRNFDFRCGAIRGYQGRCLSMVVSDGGFKEGSAVLALPFVGEAWQRFTLIPACANPIECSASSSLSKSSSALAPVAAPHAAAGGSSAAEGSAPAAAPKPLLLETPSAPALPQKYYHLPLPPNSSPALDRLRTLLEEARCLCDKISPAQRVSITCEASMLESQIPSDYRPQFLELLRLLAVNSRIQTSSPRPPYFTCNAAAPSPAVTPRNVFFDDFQVPGLSTYNVIATNIACVRLQQSSLRHMHPDVQKLALHFHPSAVDVFFVVVDGRVLQDNIAAQHPVNIICHRWVHDTLCHGRHAASRVQMTIRSPIGVSPSNHPEFAVPFTDEGLYSTFLDVYSHENEHGPVPAAPRNDGAAAAPAHVRERVALYSPNNCWFHIIPGSPFALFTLCVFHEQRACFCTMLVLIDYGDAFCSHVVAALRNTPSLPSLHHFAHEFQEASNGVRTSFESIGCKGQELLPQFPPLRPLDQQDLMARYNLLKMLPASLRHRAFYFAWLVKGRPENVHHDFGRMSYFRSRDIPADQHCTMAEAVQCILCAADELVQNLNAVVSQLLSVDPLPFHLPHDGVVTAQKLLAVACRVYEVPLPPARSLLQDLEQNHVNIVFYHTWKHMGHVEVAGAGEAEFTDDSGNPSWKFYALIDSAMQFLHAAVYDCGRRSGCIEARNCERMAACCSQDPAANHPPSSATGQTTSTAISQSSETAAHPFPSRPAPVAASSAGRHASDSGHSSDSAG